MTSVGKTVWLKTLDHLRQHHRLLTRDWFDELEPLGLKSGAFTVQAARVSQHRYLTEYCGSAFAEAAQAATGRLVSVAFTVAPEPTPEPALFELPDLDQPLNPDYHFEHFVTGPCNRLAHAASVAVSESPGQAYNPLFLHGETGTGKTHLLQAVCHHVRQANQAHRALYLSCETFADHFLCAVEAGALPAFQHCYRHVDTLVIDDIQFLAARERSQEEFFHTFNTLYQAGKQIILASDVAPRDIPDLQERLLSRFNWGLVARLDPPCLETRIAILRSKARLRCIELPESASHLIASRIDSNTRELEGALQRIQALALQYDGRIDSAVAREALADGPTSPAIPVTIQDILGAIEHHYGVKASALQGKKRTRSVVFPRQICMYLARSLTSLSLEEVGNYFGGRDHTTVLHAARTIANQRAESNELDHTLTEISRALRQR